MDSTPTTPSRGARVLTALSLPNWRTDQVKFGGFQLFESILCSLREGRHAVVASGD